MRLFDMFESYEMFPITIRNFCNLVIQNEAKIWRFLDKRKNVHSVKSADC